MSLKQGPKTTSPKDKRGLNLSEFVYFSPPSPKKHAAAEATAPGTVEADEAPKKFTPIQWVAPEPAAKPATSTEPTAAPAHGSAAEGEKAFAEMTEAEKIIARAKKYGTPVDEKALQAAKLQERAKRFNLESTEAATKGVLYFSRAPSFAVLAKHGPVPPGQERQVLRLKPRPDPLPSRPSKLISRPLRSAKRGSKPPIPKWLPKSLLVS